MAGAPAPNTPMVAPAGYGAAPATQSDSMTQGSVEGPDLSMAIQKKPNLHRLNRPRPMRVTASSLVAHVHL